MRCTSVDLHPTGGRPAEVFPWEEMVIVNLGITIFLGMGRESESKDIIINGFYRSSVDQEWISVEWKLGHGWDYKFWQP